MLREIHKKLIALKEEAREVNERAKKRFLLKPSAEIPLEENFLEGCENEFRLCA